MIMLLKLDGSLYLADKVEHVKIDLLRVRHRRLRRRGLTDPYLHRLLQEIQEKEKFDPIWVRLSRGKFSLLNGNHRLLCARALGLVQVPAYIFRRYREASLDVAVKRMRRGRRNS